MGTETDYAIILGFFGSGAGACVSLAPPGPRLAHWFRPLEVAAHGPTALVATGVLGALLLANALARREWLATRLTEPTQLVVSTYRMSGRNQGWRWRGLWRQRSGVALGGFAAAMLGLGLRAADGTASFLAAAGVLAGAAWAYSRWGRGVGWFVPLLVLAVFTIMVTRSVGAAVGPLAMTVLCTIKAFVQERGRVLWSWANASRVDEQAAAV